MKSRLLFRESGMPIRTCRRSVELFKTTALICMFVLVIFGLPALIEDEHDARAEDVGVTLAEHVAELEAQRARLQHEASARMADAYSQGLHAGRNEVRSASAACEIVP